MNMARDLVRRNFSHNHQRRHGSRADTTMFSLESSARNYRFFKTVGQACAVIRDRLVQGSVNDPGLQEMFEQVAKGVDLSGYARKANI
jgi:hypothetical protein